MKFKTHLYQLQTDERQRLAELAHTSVPMLQQIAYGNKRIELGFADALVALCDGSIALDDLPLTERAKHQHALRSGLREAA